MEGRRRSILVSRDTLLFHHGQAYRFLPDAHVKAGCFRLLKFGARNSAHAFIATLVGTPAMRHRLHAVAVYWAAYFGWGGVGYDPVAWLAQQVFTRRLGLYKVMCGAVPRGEKKLSEEKPMRAAISAVADNTPVVAPIKSALQVITGTDLITDEPVSRLGEVAGIALGLVPGGKLIAKGMKKVSEKLGEQGLKQAQKNIHTPDNRFNKRYHGPDAMTRDKDGKLTEWEAKGTQDGNTRVAKDTQNRKQGSARKNEAYAKKMLTKHKKAGKPSNRIGGPYTPQEMELWQEVKDQRGRKNHMSTHTNTETGQVRVFERDSKGKIVDGTEAKFPLNDFEAAKNNFIKEFGE